MYAGDAGPQQGRGQQIRMELTSSLVKTVLQEWVWGQCQATDIQRICYDAYKDQRAMLAKLQLSPDHISSDLETMASLGKWGRYKGNVKRDLLSALGTPSYPEFSLCRTPCMVGKDKPRKGEKIKERVLNIDVPVLAPHSLMSYLFQHHRKRFDQIMFGGDFNADELKAFWQGVLDRKDPRLQNHDMCTRKRWGSRAIPISIHGDAVPAVNIGTSGGKSYDIYSWQSILSRGRSKSVKQYMFGLFVDCECKRESEADPRNKTMEALWTFVVSSLRTAYSGQDPDSGTDLAGGFFWSPGV